MLDGLGSIPGNAILFSSPQFVDWFWTYPASYSMGTEGSLLGVGRKNSAADHAPSSGAEIERGGAIN
jgi:hypothetical protein